MTDLSRINCTTLIPDGITYSSLTAVTHPEIHLVHLGSLTYMVNGDKLLVVCERDLDETPLGTAVDHLGWRLIQDFPSAPDRERLIDWVLDNRIQLIPLGSRTELVATRAERRIKEFIEESFYAAKTDLYLKFRSRAKARFKARLTGCPTPVDYGSGSTGVNLHGHLHKNHYETRGNGSGGHLNNTDLTEYQQYVRDSIIPELDVGLIRAESRLYRPRPALKPTIKVVSVCKEGLKLADGRKFKFQ